MVLLSCHFATGAMQEAQNFTSENPFFMLNIKANRKGDLRPVRFSYEAGICYSFIDG